MQVPNVLALSLDEAIRRLEEAGVEYEVKVLLPPVSYTHLTLPTILLV